MQMDLEVDLDAMVEVFGEPNARHSHPDRGDYWFEYRRPDGVVVRFVLGVFDRKVVVGIDYGTAATTSLSLEKCDHVRVLEPEKRTLEVVATELSIRCFISLDGVNVLSAEAPTHLS